MKKLKDFTWLLYPLIVIGFVVVSAQYLFDTSRWTSLASDGEKIKTQEEQIERLRKKLAVLSAVDLVADEQNLKYLVSAVPNTKMVWFLVSELKLAASDGGVNIDEYKGQVGVGVSEASESAIVQITPENNLSIKAEIRAPDITSFKNFLGSLQSRLPLVKVAKFEYLSGEVKLTVEGAWTPSKSSVGDMSDLPDYKAKVEQAKLGLAGLVGFPEVVLTGTTSAEIVTNPF